MNWIQRNPKEIEIMILLSYLFIFLVKIWVYHFFHLFDVFKDSGSFQCIQMDVFWCPIDPGTIPDWSLIDLGKVIFSSNYSFFSNLLSQRNDSFWEICSLELSGSWIYHVKHDFKQCMQNLVRFYRTDFSKTPKHWPNMMKKNFKKNHGNGEDSQRIQHLG